MDTLSVGPVKNYTDLPDHLLHPRSRSGNKTTVLMNLGAFLSAFLVIGMYYVTQLNSGAPRTVNTQAAALPTPQKCVTGVLNPATASASIQVKSTEKQVNIGDTITTDEITFTWPDAAGAKHYYAVVSEDDGKPFPTTDPVRDGKKVTKPTITIRDLKPNTEYYLYVRSVSNIKELGGMRTALVYPTPGNCDIFYPADSIFRFKTGKI